MRILLLPAMLFLIAAGDPPPVQIERPWARASAGMAKNGAVFLTITGQGTPDRLTGFASPVADTAELHESIDDKGVMKMRPVAGLALEPGKRVTLAPGGYHVMLMGLKAPLKAGDSFPLTLRFEHAPALTVTVKVEPVGGGADHMHR
ncbi:MAG: copper chaperone PCu(A)C [Acetobacteraceae bacterium]|nr:copper chaperone PCu(A)C [Acetobacteraceae bacterium]